MSRWRCRFYRPRLVDHAAHLLGDGPRARLERHLASCQPCSRDLAALREVPPLLRTSGVPDPGEEFWLQQRRAIGRAIRNLPEEPFGWPVAWRRAGEQMRRWRVPIAVALSATVALCTYRFAEQRHPPAPETQASSAVALDTPSLAALQELMQAVVPVDEDVSADDELLAALPLDEAVGAGVPPEVPGAADLSDNELEGVDNLLGGVG